MILARIIGERWLLYFATRKQLTANSYKAKFKKQLNTPVCHRQIVGGAPTIQNRRRRRSRVPGGASERDRRNSLFQLSLSGGIIIEITWSAVCSRVWRVCSVVTHWFLSGSPSERVNLWADFSEIRSATGGEIPTWRHNIFETVIHASKPMEFKDQYGYTTESWINSVRW